ncbi:Agamous-like MADS-box protein AGL30 [Quillaja saponaria]|uniref:Agamous-like MADS-box protein AGL30 n=1 Tax=Quillaja saponaria TaxID=32244 RepID=A0AAD7P619_QUISA|nr:Agamous-like MADS-box protein AGL30 [Quillaja saponaria]
MQSSIEEVIAKFSQLTPQERVKRKLESLEALKKTFKKFEHDVNIQEYLDTSTQTVENLSNQGRLLQTQLSEIHKRLGFWIEPDKVNSVEHLGQMENSLRESLDQIQTRKESNLLLHRDIECSTSSSFGSYAGYTGTGKSTENSNFGQENGLVNELRRTASLKLQLGDQFPYLPYNFSLLHDPKFQLVGEMNPLDNPVDYHVNGSFEAGRPGYDSIHQGWDSTSGPCGFTMFDEHLFSQDAKYSIGNQAFTL